MTREELLQLIDNVNVKIDNAKTMTETSSKTNNFNGPMSGVIGSDNAQVSNNQFNQINNANTAELLKLISSMCETATQFPEDIRDEIIIDIEDVETEIKKPENKWNKARLKKSLKAIAAGAAAIGVGIAGAVDLANKTIDLGDKVGIEIQVPWTR